MVRTPNRAQTSTAPAPEDQPPTKRDSAHARSGDRLPHDSQPTSGFLAEAYNIGIFEPDLTRVAMIEQHPMAWLVEVDGFILDVRTLPAEVQAEARRRGLIPDLDALRAA